MGLVQVGELVLRAQINPEYAGSTPATSTMDKDSEEFIKWVEERLRDEEFFHEFKKECVRKLANYYSYPNSHLLSTLKAKLIVGAQEHGSPAKYTQEEIDRELRMEYIDILGWTLIGEWLLHEKRNIK